jgi:hypothetical protein
MPISSPVLAKNSLLEIDHFFICVKTAIEPSVLTALGLTSTAEVLHRPQQGTASRSIFFENIYLELIWVEDAEIAESYAQQSGMDFSARSQQQASPFGIALRQTLDMSHRPFDLLPSQQGVRSSDVFINFAAPNLRLQSEPFCFVISDAVSLIALLDRTSPIHQRLLEHRAGMKRLTNARVSYQATGQMTDSMSLLQHENVIQVDSSTEPLLTLTFDDQVQQQTIDLRASGIPIVLNY